MNLFLFAVVKSFAFGDNISELNTSRDDMHSTSSCLNAVF